MNKMELPRWIYARSKKEVRSTKKTVVGTLREMRMESVQLQEMGCRRDPAKDQAR